MPDNKTEKTAQRNVKNSVFCDLFEQKENILKLYKSLHPEDTTATEDDIDGVNIENVLTNDIYNDLGFTVRNRLVILVEAQATWTLNILIRVLIYLAETYRRYSRENGIDLYSTTKAKLPVPELYVIYTGEEAVPDRISLKDDFFDGVSVIDAEVKVITDENPSDIVGQYIIFSKVITEQIKIYGKTRKAVEEAIRICLDRNVLKEYLSKREGEVITVMMSLFDQEEVTRISLLAQRKEGIVLGAISTMRDLGLSEREIAERIKDKYHLDDAQVDEYLGVIA